MMKKGFIYLGCLAFLGFGLPSLGLAKAKSPDPEKRIEKYSLTQGESVLIKAKKARLPFVLYGDESGKKNPYVPSGYMGDGSSLKVTGVYESAPLASGLPGQTALKITYTGKGREGWSGIYWLTPANNWGRVKGAGYDFSRAKRLTFWVKGKEGGEVLNVVKVGGIADGSFPDSDEASIGPIRLSDQWEQYAIDFKNKDMRHIIGGFCFVVRRIDNRKGATFYVDEIVYERKKGEQDLKQDVVDYRLQPSTESAFAPGPVYTDPNPPNAVTTPIRKIIPFTSAKSAFDEHSKNVLEEVVTKALEDTRLTVIVEGHTDDVGPAGVNMRLSRQRAQSVADYMINQGMDRGRLVVIGYGEERPISPGSNATEEGRKKNRRVEVILVPE
jgi:outer membrane protein OmpA-like peptidoglycan-associated protein